MSPSNPNETSRSTEANMASESNAPAESLSATGGAWSALVVLGTVWALILYGALLPFRFDWELFTRPTLDSFRRFTSQIGSTEDVAVNLILFFPIGALLFEVLHDTLQRSKKRWQATAAFSIPSVLLRNGATSLDSIAAPEGARKFQGSRFVGIVSCCFAIAVATTLAGALSLCIEWLQVGVRERQPSWIDCLLNTAGAGLGATAMLVVRPGALRASARIRRLVRRRPFLVSAFALGAGILAMNLAPFDFVRNTSEFHDQLRAATWKLSMLGDAEGLGGVEPLFHEIAWAFWFSVLGFGVGLAIRESGLRRSEAFLAALAVVFCFASLIEGMQLFTRSHVGNLFTMLLRFLSGAAGVWTALGIVDVYTRSVWRVRRRVAIPSLLIAASLCAIILWWAAQTMTQGKLPPRSGLHFVIPFEALWRADALLAATHVGEQVLCLGFFSLLLSTAVRRLGVKSDWLVTTSIVLVAAAAREFGVWAAANQPIDASALVIAGASVFAARIAHLRWMSTATPLSQPASS